MFRQMPIILAMIIIIIVVFGDFIPTIVAQFLFGISISIKSLIIFFLPIIIFSLLYRAAVNLMQYASKIVLLIITAVVVSNFLATSFSQFLGVWIYKFDINLITPNKVASLQPKILFQFPALFSNHISMFFGVTLGILSAKIIPDHAQIFASLLRKMVNNILSLINFLIPIFVAGFVIKLNHDDIILKMILDYTVIFVIIVIAAIIYIGSLYIIVNKFSFTNALISVKNMIPATLSGFCTMSGVASMPLALIGTERNAKNKYLVHTIVPSTVNIHLVGDCIVIPSFAFAILKSYGIIQPDFFTYFIFSIYFVFAKFFVVAVPAGGIIIMLPVLEKHLGFNTEMLSLITALYILFDSVITSVNVLGNGALAKFIDTVTTPKKETIYEIPTK